jgi:hypothetical protein
MGRDLHANYLLQGSFKNGKESEGGERRGKEEKGNNVNDYNRSLIKYIMT